jgi:hypothetical protein
MTQDEIIEMANQAGIVNPQMVINTLEDFAKLVAQHEREACAKLVDAAKAGEEDWDSNDWNQAVEFCASRIRARGQA